MCTTTVRGNSSLPIRNVAKTSSPYNTTCDASSYYHDDPVVSACDHVMNGQECDDLSCNWVSNNEMASSWIQLNFNRAWNVVQVDIQQRPNAVDQCSGLRLEFSSGAGAPLTVSIIRS
jgi:hypothetical protein